MPIYDSTTVDALHLDGVLLLDVDRGMAVVDLARASFVDAYALTRILELAPFSRNVGWIRAVGRQER